MFFASRKGAQSLAVVSALALLMAGSPAMATETVPSTDASGIDTPATNGSPSGGERANVGIEIARPAGHFDFRLDAEFEPSLVNTVTKEKYEAKPGLGYRSFKVPAGTYNIEISGRCFGASADEPKQSYIRKETVTVREGGEPQTVELPFENLAFCGQVQGKIELPGGPDSKYKANLLLLDEPKVTPGLTSDASVIPDSEGNFVFHNVKPGTHYPVIVPVFGLADSTFHADIVNDDPTHLKPSDVGVPVFPAGMYTSPYCTELFPNAQGITVEAGKIAELPKWKVKSSCAPTADGKIEVQGTAAVGETLKSQLSGIDISNARVHHQWYFFHSEGGVIEYYSTGLHLPGFGHTAPVLPGTSDLVVPASMDGRSIRVVAYVNQPGKNTIALFSEPMVVGEKKAEGNQPGTTTPTPSTPKPEENTPGPVAELKADKSSVIPAAKVIIKGEGFLAGEDIRLEFHSDPVVLGTVKADAKGAFSVELTVPANAAAGQHHFVAVGLKSGKVIKTPVTVDKPGAKPSANPKGALAKTGSSAEALLLASIGLGLAGVAAYRRRTAR